MVSVAIFFFFFDFLVSSLASAWVARSLLTYFIATILDGRRSLFFYSFCIFLLLLQDFFFYGHFGISLLYLLPVLGAALLFRRFLYRYWLLLAGYFLVVFALLFEFILVKKLLFSWYGGWESTKMQIFSSLLILTLLCIGTRGNRFFLGKRGKSGLRTKGMPYKGGQ